MDKNDPYDINELKNRLKFKQPPYDVDKNFELLQKKIQKKELIQPVGKSSGLWKWAGIAATFALMVVSSLHFIKQEELVELVWYETTAVPDAKTKVVLPDSSVVWLNANAFIRYPHYFGPDKRNVIVSGDLTFEVKKDETPFFVETDGLKIKVLGTMFNVYTDKKEDEIEITLLEGKIALYKNTNLTEIPDEVMSPVQQAKYSKTANEISLASTRPESVTSWMTGIFKFEGNSLEEITEELQRAFHTKIHIENEELKNKTFNATFEYKETLDEILSILQISARYKIDKRRGEIYLN